MLRELRIRDFAIIDELALSFQPGLNVITGETGAGKSIILQALALLCGTRAAADLIRDQADEASIEGLFECDLPAPLREALGVEGNEIAVRRHLARSGKSRIYVNGSPTTLALLAQLGDELVHIYGQHEQALLLRPGSHCELLDRFAELGAVRQRMAAAYAALRDARAQLTTLEGERATRAERRELLEFQHAELSDAAVQVGEDAELRREREQLRHAERLQQVCGAGEAMLYSGEGATVAALGRLAAQLAGLAAVAPTLAAAAELVENGRVQLEEAALQLRAAVDRFEANPERLEAIEARLQLIARLSRKHGVSSDELPAVEETLRGELATLAAHTRDAAAARQQVADREAAAHAVARELSSARRAAARRLEQRMGAELGTLGLAGATFGVELEARAGTAEALGPTGVDAVEFLLAANPGEAPKSLARIASGGELSRILLALKALTASIGETPILIFDEVDAGIGGAVADAVARRLKTLAANRQLLCITHLPQIAAYADHHYAVEKQRQGRRTIAHARALETDERVAEVSRMLGGGTAPAEAERYARRLLAEAQRPAEPSLTSSRAPS
jgi:DNA repair protein RecN (Recombination protein N)